MEEQLQVTAWEVQVQVRKPLAEERESSQLAPNAVAASQGAEQDDT